MKTLDCITQKALSDGQRRGIKKGLWGSFLDEYTNSYAEGFIQGYVESVAKELKELMYCGEFSFDDAKKYFNIPECDATVYLKAIKELPDV